MKATMFALLVGMTLAIVGCSSSGTTGGAAATNAEKIIGKWTVSKMGGKETPKEISLSVEFTKDGKTKMTSNFGGKEETDEGTYKIEGDKIITTEKDKATKKDKSETMTIKSLTADTLVVYDDEKKQEMELKKK